MPAYRLFFLDGAEHIREFAVIECEDDGEAVRLAGQKADGRAMELWYRDRLVRQFPIDQASRLHPPIRPPFSRG